MKILEQKHAIELRKSGHSLGEISKMLKISKSTASIWTKHVVIDKAGLLRIEGLAIASRVKGHEILHQRKLKRLRIAESEAKTLLGKIAHDKNTALIGLSMMYWCEGKKNDNGIGFTNSDPELVRAFIVMMKKVFKIDKNKWRVCMHLHDYHDETELLDFWSDATGIPPTQFNKSFRKESNHAYIRDGYKGCVRVSYGDARISRTLISFAKNFIKLYI